MTPNLRLEELTQEFNLHAKNLPLYVGANDRRIDSTKKRIRQILKDIGKIDPEMAQKLSTETHVVT